MLENEPVRKIQKPKVVATKKFFTVEISDHAQNLILDCIASLPDQEQLGISLNDFILMEKMGETTHIKLNGLIVKLYIYICRAS